MKAEPYHGTNENEYLCPLNLEGGGCIIFGADPVGIDVGVGLSPRALSPEPNDVL